MNLFQKEPLKHRQVEFLGPAGKPGQWAPEAPPSRPCITHSGGPTKWEGAAITTTTITFLPVTLKSPKVGGLPLSARSSEAPVTPQVRRMNNGLPLPCPAQVPTPGNPKLKIIKVVLLTRDEQIGLEGDPGEKDRDRDLAQTAKLGNRL